MPDTMTPENAQKRRTRRLRKIRQGAWVREMTDDEWELYVANCNLLGKEIKPREGRANLEEQPTNVVPLHKGEDRGGLVPEGGASAENGDHRKRYNLKYAGRLGKRWSEIIQGVKDGHFTWDEFVNSLTAEELARGQLMDKNGNFQGRPPSFVPKAFHDACIKELLGRGRVLYKENYIKAISAMSEIASSKTAKDADRIKAAIFVIERLEGKVPDKLEIGVTDPWQTIINGIIAEVDEEQISNAQQYLNRMGGDQA